MGEGLALADEPLRRNDIVWQELLVELDEALNSLSVREARFAVPRLHILCEDSLVIGRLLLGCRHRLTAVEILYGINLHVDTADRCRFKHPVLKSGTSYTELLPLEAFFLGGTDPESFLCVLLPRTLLLRSIHVATTSLQTAAAAEVEVTFTVDDNEGLALGVPPLVLLGVDNQHKELTSLVEEGSAASIDGKLLFLCESKILTVANELSGYGSLDFLCCHRNLALCAEPSLG